MFSTAQKVYISLFTLGSKRSVMNVISTAATNQSRGFYWPTSGFLINEEMKKRKKMMNFQRSSRRTRSCDVADRSVTRRRVYQSTGHKSFNSYFEKANSMQYVETDKNTTTVIKKTPSKKSSLGNMLVNLVTRGNTFSSKTKKLENVPTRCCDTGSRRCASKSGRNLAATRGKWVTIRDG